MNKKVSEETFGSGIVQPSVTGGRLVTFGHMANDKPMPDRGTSANVKTGYPVKGGK